MNDLLNLLISPTTSIRDAMVCINANARGIVLVVDDGTHLLGTITDGDIRRAVLAGTDLDLAVVTLLRAKDPAEAHPLTAPVGTPNSELLRVMTEHGLRHIPVLDAERRVIDLAVLSDLALDTELRLRAVIMAGGHGMRLRPLTNETPKPMLPVGDRPLLELMIDRMRGAGIRRVHLTTHYRPEVIRDHFGDGQAFGVAISYTNEDQPLGTAGALGALPEMDDRLLVINGDIMTGLDFRAMLHFHEDHHADITVVVRDYVVEVPYGVVATAPDGVAVAGITEKPVLHYSVNAGIYLLNPEVCRLVPRDERCDMPELIEAALAAGRRAVCFPLREYWLDIGRKADYERAQVDYAAGRV